MKRVRCSAIALASAIALPFALTACSAEQAVEARSTHASAEAPVLETPELMLHVLEPAARNFWKGWGEILDENGWRDISPKTDAEWKTVEDGAATALIVGDLLLSPSYAKEPRDDWEQQVQAFTTIASEARIQAMKQNSDAMFDLGERLDQSCDTCHAQFAPHVP